MGHPIYFIVLTEPDNSTPKRMFISLLQPCPPENTVTSQPWGGGSLRIAPVPRSPRVAGKKLLLFSEQFCYIIQRPDFDCPHFLDEETEDSRGVGISPGTHSQKWMPAGFGSKVFVSEITACFLLFLLHLSIPFQGKGSENSQDFPTEQGKAGKHHATRWRCCVQIGTAVSLPSDPSSSHPFIKHLLCCTRQVRCDCEGPATHWIVSRSTNNY